MSKEKELHFEKTLELVEGEDAKVRKKERVNQTKRLLGIFNILAYAYLGFYALINLGWLLPTTFNLMRVEYLLPLIASIVLVGVKSFFSKDITKARLFFYFLISYLMFNILFSFLAGGFLAKQMQKLSDIMGPTGIGFQVLLMLAAIVSAFLLSAYITHNLFKRRIGGFQSGILMFLGIVLSIVFLIVLGSASLLGPTVQAVSEFWLFWAGSVIALSAWYLIHDEKGSKMYTNAFKVVFKALER